MLPVASANATANVISFEQIPPIENPFKKTYTADRIENVGWFVHRAAGLVALGAVAAVVAAPFVTGLAMGTALVWGVGATVATYGLGFGVNQLADIVRGFESPRVKQEKDDAANFQDLANTERKSLFREIYRPAIRGQIINGLSSELQQQLAARQAEPPAPVATAAPAPVMIKPIWGDSASYELYGIDTKSNLNFSQNISENSSFNGLSNENIKLSLNYEFSLDTAALQRLGLTQFQRIN
jgi:hypothetical protein